MCVCAFCGYLLTCLTRERMSLFANLPVCVCLCELVCLFVHTDLTVCVIDSHPCLSRACMPAYLCLPVLGSRVTLLANLLPCLFTCLCACFFAYLPVRLCHLPCLFCEHVFWHSCICHAGGPCLSALLYACYFMLSCLECLFTGRYK